MTHAASRVALVAVLAEAFGSGSGITVQIAVLLGGAAVSSAVTAAVAKAIHGLLIKTNTEMIAKGGARLDAIESALEVLEHDKTAREAVAKDRASQSSASLRRTTRPHPGAR